MPTDNLNIDSKSIEDLYAWYSNKLLVVNRRYQRKLVWSIDEKKALISSIVEEYPIPLLLFVKTNDNREILDGMQRLEAVMSFIEQKFAHNDHYFDLDATALTKQLKDVGTLVQETPVMSRDDSVKLARYKFAVSEYSSASHDIDEVFRRINSNGKRLSKQELRSAGCVTNFSELVRKISTQVRGDTSHGDILKLNSMSKISINNDGLGYGVSINEHFYVSNGILTRTSVRESADEELVANILGYIALTEKPTSGSEQLDGFYGIKDTSHTSTQRALLESYIQTNGEDKILKNYVYVYDQIKSLFNGRDSTFKQQILGDQVSSHESPRYYQAVFLAFYELLITKNLEIDNADGLFNQLKDTGTSVISVSDGGRWAASKRKESVENLEALILRHFKESQRQIENNAWVTEIENILTSSQTEQSYYDFKQGFMSLSGNHKFEDSTLEGVLKTCVGINNIGKDSEGFVLIGVADKEAHAQRLNTLYGVDSIEKNGFYITGIDHEASQLFGDIDTYFMALKDKITANYSLTEELKQQILKDVRVCDYKGKHLIKIPVKSVGKVCNLDQKLYLRQTTSTTLIDDFDAVQALMTNYIQGT
ncbi:conserved hypothetical protein [Vibrio chagasii]|uniref:DUF262 domain-containing protein n=1 Tax=Vibrio sp. F12 TaxID=2070776 RepID=UPI0010BDCAD1|nr:DUF262 domain-containing protein [Vibrio sp. F12]CAH6892321.1 conserved hypothetical protein [Vibrio chagasii]TKE89837.1 DUF262 domain-containing protein [Vibrio sp. F12]CAH6904103.1 conserved hypothetical protein [Vibrio chagasii]CAH6907699.1 conserved hypothetical protein [Vibrio chagasii]CAH6962493.1 conserved hypothetical protein [Vibrio chagasii]